MHYKIDWNKILIKSKLFSVDKEFDLITLTDCFENNNDNYNIFLNADKLVSKITVSEGFDIVIGITDYAFSDNFYIKRLSKNTAIISIASIKYILEDKIPIENFIIKCIYELATLYEHFWKNLRSSEIPSIIHSDTRKCLFDMNGDLFDIIESTNKIGLCNECKIKLNTEQHQDNYIKILEKELSKIKIPLYIKLREFFRKRTLLSLFILFIISILTSLIAGYLMALFY
jgi:hypothetical protein